MHVVWHYYPSDQLILFACVEEQAIAKHFRNVFALEPATSISRIKIPLDFSAKSSLSVVTRDLGSPLIEEFARHRVKEAKSNKLWDLTTIEMG